jgi:hypothetical protein
MILNLLVAYGVDRSIFPFGTEPATVRGEKQGSHGDSLSRTVGGLGLRVWHRADVQALNTMVAEIEQTDITCR